MRKKIIKIMIYILIAVIALTVVALIILNQPQFGKLPSGKRLERIQKSPNYKDGTFKNLSETPVMTDDKNRFTTIMKFLFDRNKNTTPKDIIPSIKTDLKSLDRSKDVLIWMGHSSYFIQLDGKRILVDPVLNGHASPFSFMIKAFRGADIYKIEDIPAIDYLFITHDHWDHLDYKTVLDLKDRVSKVVCGLGVGEHLEYWGYAPENITELDWDEQTSPDSNWNITATPARHFSGRDMRSNRTLWASFVLQSPSFKIFIGGDGGFDTHFAQIGEKYGPFDLAILEQGQYDQKWKYIHTLPEQAIQASEDLKAKRLLPVHNSKFALGNHDWQEPLEKIVSNCEGHSLLAITPLIGEPVNLKDSTQVFRKWWEGVK